VYEATDVVYQRQGEREFLASVRQPDGRGPFPTVADVHGGAWHVGDRHQNAVVHAAVAAAGTLVVASDFRQSQDAPYSASILDINLETASKSRTLCHGFRRTHQPGSQGLVHSSRTVSSLARCG
jgi:hypothetical protein